MAIPIEQLRSVVDAGHPDSALVAMPVSLLRAMLAAMPAATIVRPPLPQDAAA